MRVGTQGLFRPCLKTFVPPFLPTRLTAPGSPRMVRLVKSTASEPGLTKIVEINKSKKPSAMNTRIGSFYYVRNHLAFFCPINPKTLKCVQRWRVSLHNCGRVAAAWKRSHQWCVFLTPNNTKTMGRMTCHCFQRPIRRDLTIHWA